MKLSHTNIEALTPNDYANGDFFLAIEAHLLCRLVAGLSSYEYLYGTPSENAWGA